MIVIALRQRTLTSATLVNACFYHAATHSKFAIFFALFCNQIVAKSRTLKKVYDDFRPVFSKALSV